MKVLLILSASFVGFGVGCTAPVGSELHVPEDAANTCHAHCHSIGLELSAVAIMANNVGCVCQVNTTNKATGPVGASEAVTGGMATIMLQAEARRRQEEQQRARAHY